MNVRPKTIKLLEEKTGSTLFDTGLSNIFLDMSPQARQTKAKKKKMGLYWSKTFCAAWKTSNKTKRQPTEWKKIFASHISNKGLKSRIHKELMQEKMNRHFSKEAIQLAKRQKCSTPQITREMPMKTKMGSSRRGAVVSKSN